MQGIAFHVAAEHKTLKSISRMCKHKVKNSFKGFYVDNLIHLEKVRYPLSHLDKVCLCSSKKRGVKGLCSCAQRRCSNSHNRLMHLRRAAHPPHMAPGKWETSPSSHCTSELWRMSFSRRHLCPDCLHESQFQDSKLYLKSLTGKIEKAFKYL